MCRVCVESHCAPIRLTYSEALGDVIYEYSGREPRMADICLALAHIVYAACGLHHKAALSMCKRGMLYSATEFIYQCQNFTTGEEGGHVCTREHTQYV